MTAVTELRQCARAQAHDITDPSATVTGKDVAERLLSREVRTVVAGGSLCLARAKAGAGVTLGETSYTVVFQVL